MSVRDWSPRARTTACMIKKQTRFSALQGDPLPTARRCLAGTSPPGWHRAKPAVSRTEPERGSPGRRSPTARGLAPGTAATRIARGHRHRDRHGSATLLHPVIEGAQASATSLLTVERNKTYLRKSAREKAGIKPAIISAVRECNYYQTLGNAGRGQALCALLRSPAGAGGRGWRRREGRGGAGLGALLGAGTSPGAAAVVFTSP